MSPSEFNLMAQCACVRRELGMRRFVYPQRIAAGKMTHAEAERETACMEAVLVTLTKLQMEEQRRTELPLLFDDAKTNNTP